MKKDFVYVSPGIVFLAAILIYLDGIAFVIQCISACALHEFGHYSAARLNGNKIRSIRITAVGAEIYFDTGRSFSYFGEIITAFAGPVVNLITAWISVKLNAFLFAGINLCLGIINLLPIRPLDGGRILTSILSLFFPNAADGVVSCISIMFSGCLLGLGWLAWKTWGNVSLLLTAAWIVLESIDEKN